MSLFTKGTFAKEAIPEVLAWMVKNGNSDAQRAADALGLGGTDEAVVKEICARVVREREGFIRERGEGALGPLMGIVMKELRGKADGKLISETLRGLIARLLG